MHTYWNEIVCGGLAWDIDMFWFEAFDEPQKVDAKGEDGQMRNEKHWGSFNFDTTPKFNMKCPFANGTQ
jgi:glucan 1,3-beta-glucosidase